MLEADRHLRRGAAVPVVRLGTTGSVGSAPRSGLRAAVVTSMSAIGFMEASVALVAITFNHGFASSIRSTNTRSTPHPHLSRGSTTRFLLPRGGGAVAHSARRLPASHLARAAARDPTDRPRPRRARSHCGGALLLRHADAVSGRLRLATEQLGALVREERRHLAVGAFPSAIATIVPEALVRMRAADPDLEVNVAEGTLD